MKSKKAAKKTGKISFQNVAAVLTSLSSAMALLALVCWPTGKWEWLSLGTDRVPIAPSTAFLLMLLNVLLLEEFFRPEDPVWRRSCRWVAVLIAVSGLLALLRPFFGWSSPLEEWLSGTTRTLGALPVGQMSPLTGLVFLLSSAAFLAEALPILSQRLLSWVRFGLSTLVLWISAVVSFGYLAGVSIFSDRPIIPMALWTSIAFFLTGVAMALKNDSKKNPELFVTPQGEKSLVQKRSWILLFSLMTLAIIAGGLVYYRSEATRIQKAKTEELAAIGTMKVEQILLWHKERVADISRFARSPVVRPLLMEWRHRPDDTELRKSLLERLELETELGIYFQALLGDADKHILLSFPEAPEMETESWDAIKKAQDSLEPVLSELHFSISGQLHEEISMAARDESGRPLAVMMLIADPKEFLFPLIQTWPTASRTAETLLVRRDGEDVLFLNELRHRKGTAMILRIPLSQTTLPAAQAVLGRTGVFVGKDYRGVEVLSDLRPVPRTSWYLVSKEDTSEILSEIRYRAVIVSGAVVMLVLAVAGFMGYAYRVQRLEERKKSEEERSRFWKVMDLSINEIYMFDPESLKFNYVNAGALKNLEYSIEEMQRLTPLDLKPEFTESSFRRAIKPLADHEKEVVRFETVHKRKNGSLYPVDVHLQLVRADMTETFVAIIFDMTDRKIALEAARQKEIFLATLTSQVPGMLYRFMMRPDGTYCVPYSSAGIKEIFGCSPEDVLNNFEPIFKVICPEDQGKITRTIDESIRSLNPWACEYRVQVPGKPLKWISGHSIPQKAADGSILWTGYNVDVSDRKVADEKIRELNVELEDRVKRRTAELVAVVKELEAFGYSIAHDLKAPLRAMAGFANILVEDYGPKLDDNGRRVIGVITENSGKMAHMIDDLLKLSHMGRIAMDEGEIDMTALAGSVCRELKEGSFSDRAIDVSVKPLPPARADSTLVKQLLINIISNAMKFTSRKEKAVIEIGAYEKDGERVYYVKDNGAGFDMKYAHKLFGVFQRIHTQDEFGGTGIGLAIVRSAVERHGGRVWAEGEAGQGATFYFTLRGR